CVAIESLSKPGRPFRPFSRITTNGSLDPLGLFPKGLMGLPCFRRTSDLDLDLMLREREQPLPLELVGVNRLDAEALPSFEPRRLRCAESRFARRRHQLPRRP